MRLIRSFRIGPGRTTARNDGKPEVAKAETDENGGDDEWVPPGSHVGLSSPLHQLRWDDPITNSIRRSLSRTLCRPLPTMPSIRVKTSRSFYKTIDEEAPASPAPQNKRPRSKSVIEVFGSPFLQSPDPQSPRPQSYAPNLGGARLSRVSQLISNSSREGLPGPSTQPQYRESNLSQDDAGAWDEDETEAVIDHLDVIGAKTLYSS